MFEPSNRADDSLTTKSTVRTQGLSCLVVPASNFYPHYVTDVGGDVHTADFPHR